MVKVLVKSAKLELNTTWKVTLAGIWQTTHLGGGRVGFWEA
jgi:hypothetical protein